MIAALLSTLMAMFSFASASASRAADVEADPTTETPEETGNENPADTGAEDTPEDEKTSAPPDPDTPVQPEPQIIEQPEPVLEQVTGPDAMAGRVKTLVPEDHADITELRIIAGPETGNVTVNPDNTLALVMTYDKDATGSVKFTYEADYADGSTRLIESEHALETGTQEAGWGQGEFYMLETGDDDRVVVETGDVHRPVYISGSEDALSRADIAALEGLDEADITTGWLVDHPEYGSSEDMALDTEAGMAVWYDVTLENDKETSHWLLFEKGYEYDPGRIISSGLSGEDELHPLHVTSYGEGEKPVINSNLKLFQQVSENVVFSDVELAEGGFALEAENIIFEDIGFGDGFAFQHGSGLTVRHSYAYDIVKETPSNESDYFAAHLDRVTAHFVSDTDRILFENSFWDHNGWVDGYTEDNLAINGQPPSQYSQNLYIQNDTTDVTFRDNITMRAASFGAQLRGGAFIEDNIFLDNNAAFNFLGGVYNGDGPIGNYSLVTDNVTTSGAHKVADQIGGLTFGMENKGPDNTLLQNLVAHLANPDDPSELDDKYWTHSGLYGGGEDNTFYDDTIIYNWQGQRVITASNVIAEQNIEDVDPTIADQTTIQRFTADLLGQETATIDDLANFLRAQADGTIPTTVTADDIIAYFQEGFGIEQVMGRDATTLRFVPNELGDGIRWDNRLNWDTEDLPGTMDGDSVDLAGNWVNYGGTTTINDLDFGSGGKLNVSHGKLTVDGEITTDGLARINIEGAGQVWTDGYDDTNRLLVSLSGGRFANTGEIDGRMTIQLNDGEAILATDDNARMDLMNGSRISIRGDEGKIGFDGDEGGIGVLRIADRASLHFKAQNGEGLSAIEEFRSGSQGNDAPDVESGVNLGLATLDLDVTAISGMAGSHRLIEVDGLIGEFGDIKLTGLGTDQDAEVVVDYATDTVTLNLLEPGEGNGLLSLRVESDETDGLDAGSDLWAALTEGQGTYSDDDPTRLYVDEEEMELAL